MPRHRPEVRFHYLIALVAISSASLVGCTGSTRETLNIRPGGPTHLAVPIAIEKVIASRNAPGLINVGSMRIGAFDLNDLGNIRGSLNDTLRAAAAPAPADIDDRLRLSVVIRRYLVAHSNNAGGVLAAVDWCAARGDGSAIYREIFYATGEGWLVTVGEIKNRAHRGLVQRVAESALRLAAVGSGAPDLPVRVEGTHDTIEAAAESVPSFLKSYAVGGPELIFTALAATENLATPRIGIAWGAARTEGSISCQQLQGLGGGASSVEPVIATPATPVPVASPPAFGRSAAVTAPVVPRSEAAPSDSAQAGAGGSDIYCRPAFAYAGACGQDPNAQ